MSQNGLDQVRQLVRAVMATRGLTWGAFGKQERTAQRFLDGENIRAGSLRQVQAALGIGGLTFYFVEHGQWAQALDQPNAEDVRTLLQAMVPASPRPRVLPAERPRRGA